MASRNEIRTEWLKYERARNKYYRKYTRIWRSYYNKVADDMVLAMREQVPVEEVITYEDTRVLFVQMYQDTGTKFATEAFINLKRDVQTWEQMMTQYVLTEGAESISSVYNTNIEQAQAIIRAGTAQAVTEGITADQMSRYLEQYVSDNWKIYGKWSAERIARTEIVAASNYGSLIGAKSTGLQFRKIWLTTLDGRERPAHAEAIGQNVGKDESFTVGGEQLEFPGAKTGSAENVINCRCSVLYRTEFI